MATRTPKLPTPPPLTPEAVVTLPEPTLADTATALAATKLEVTEAARVFAEARSNLGKVKSDPNATKEQDDAAFNAFNLAQGNKARAEVELNALEELHAKLKADKDAEDNAAENERIAAMVADVAEYVAHVHDHTYEDVKEFWDHIGAAHEIWVRKRDELKAAAAKVKSVEKYLPRDAKGYPEIVAPDGSVAGGATAAWLHMRGGTLSGIHPLILCSDWDIPLPSKDKPDGFEQFPGLVARYCESMSQGQRHLAKYGVEHFGRSALNRFSTVAQKHLTKRLTLEEWEELTRADEKARQAEGIANGERVIRERNKRILVQQIRGNGQTVAKNGTPVNPPETEGEIIEAAPFVPVDPAIAHEYYTATGNGNPDRSPRPSAKAAPATQTQRIAATARMTPSQQSELDSVLAIRAAQIERAKAAPKSPEGELGAGNTILGHVAVPGVDLKGVD